VTDPLSRPAEVAGADAAAVEAAAGTPGILSPTWPTRPSTSTLLTTLLVAVLAVPVLIAREPGTSLALALTLPLIGCGLITRFLFEVLTPGPRRRVAVVAAAAGAAVAGNGIALLLGLLMLAAPSPAATAGATVSAAACLVAAWLSRARELRLGALNRRVFFVGTPQQHRDLDREIARRGDMSLVGCLPLGANARPRPELVAAVTEARPTTLVLSAEAARNEGLVAAASEVHAEGVRVRGLSEFYEREFRKVPISDLSHAWFLFDVAELHRHRVFSAAKRLRESALAALLLLLALPLMVVIAIAIRLTDGAPIMYRQRRVGLGGQVFTMPKFRTMRVAPSDRPQAWATVEAARITRVGRILRRYRLDELPQLWSVVKGDLALVGPRPEQPALVEQLERSIEFYGARLRARPGLTGWAQVNFGYGGSVNDTIEKLQFDFFYIRRQSLRLDLLILAATLRTMISGGGR
jgi:exopolysaccharide biosynthesis polyprenyl glycosylphosphotransferase